MKELHALHPSNVTPFFNTANVSLHDQLNLAVELPLQFEYYRTV